MDTLGLMGCSSCGFASVLHSHILAALTARARWTDLMAQQWITVWERSTLPGFLLSTQSAVVRCLVISAVLHSELRRILLRSSHRMFCLLYSSCLAKQPANSREDYRTPTWSSKEAFFLQLASYFYSVCFRREAGKLLNSKLNQSVHNLKTGLKRWCS